MVELEKIKNIISYLRKLDEITVEEQARLMNIQERIEKGTYTLNDIEYFEDIYNDISEESLGKMDFDKLIDEEEIKKVKKSLENKNDNSSKKEPTQNEENEIISVSEFINELKKLNSKANIKLDKSILSGDNKIYSSIPVEQLELPKGFYYNEKNGITNKHNTNLGMYMNIDAELLNSQNDANTMTSEEEKEFLNTQKQKEAGTQVATEDREIDKVKDQIQENIKESKRLTQEFLEYNKQVIIDKLINKMLNESSNELTEQEKETIKKDVEDNFEERLEYYNNDNEFIISIIEEQIKKLQDKLNNQPEITEESLEITEENKQIVIAELKKAISNHHNSITDRSKQWELREILNKLNQNQYTIEEIIKIIKNNNYNKNNMFSISLTSKEIEIVNLEIQKLEESISSLENQKQQKNNENLINEKKKELEQKNKQKEELENKLENSKNTQVGKDNEELKKQLKDKQDLLNKFKSISNKKLNAIEAAYEKIKDDIVKTLENDEEFLSKDENERFEEIKEKVTKHPEYENITKHSNSEKMTNELVEDINNKLKQKEKENEEEVEVEKDKKLWMKALTGVGGFALGFAAAYMTPGVGHIRMAMASAKIVGSVINTATKNENGKGIIDRISSKIGDRFPTIQKGVETIQKIVNDPRVKWFSNGFTAGYLTGNIVEVFKQKLKEKAAEEATKKTTETIVKDTGEKAADNLDDLDNFVPKHGDVIDLSQLKYGNISSTSNKILHLLHGIGEDQAIFDKSKIVNGVEKWHILTPDSDGYVWVTKKEAIKAMKQAAKTAAKSR
jgi:hypothetical protein